MHRNIFLLLITFSLMSSAVAQEHTLELTLKKRGHWQKTWKGLLMKNLYSNRIVE